MSVIPQEALKNKLLVKIKKAVNQRPLNNHRKRNKSKRAQVRRRSLSNQAPKRFWTQRKKSAVKMPLRRLPRNALKLRLAWKPSANACVKSRRQEKRPKGKSRLSTSCSCVCLS
jgi:hypothetical protein